MADMEFRVCKYRKFIVSCIRGPELISYLIPRIKELQDDVGNRLKRRLSTDDSSAHVSPVDELIDIIIKSTEPGKWKTFIDGLQQSDYPYLAEILESKSVAADNVDYEQKIMQLFAPDLEKHILPQEILSELYSKDIISTTDKENILARERTHGTTAAAVVLLDRMQCRTDPKFWYPEFLGILMEKGHGQLVNVVDPDFADCARQCQLIEAAAEGAMLTKAHAIEPVVKAISTGGKLPIIICENHGGLDISGYCHKHDVWCCETCKTVSHMKCAVQSVADMMKSSTNDSQLADIEASMRSIEAQVNKLKLSRQQSVATIKSMEQSCEAAVRKAKKEIVDWAERMENKTLAEIHSTAKKWVDVISEQAGTCGTLISQVKKGVDVTSEARSILDRKGQHVAAHKLSRMLIQMTKTVSEIEQETSNICLSYKMDQKLDLLKTYTQLGTLDVTATADTSVSPQLTGGSGCIGKSIRDMTVASSTRVNVPSDIIAGSVFLPDGRLVLADLRNNKLLLLDRGLNLKSELQLPGRPWDVAVVGNSDVIVTLPYVNKLMYVDVDTTPRTGRTIYVNRMCWSVAVVGGDIYVSVHDDPGNGAVLVMDGVGQVSRRIGVDDRGRGIFERPSYIAVSAQGTLYVSDYVGGISCYSGKGHKLYHVHHKDMMWLNGIQIDRDGNLLVCWGSDDVLVLKPDGALDRVFLTSRDGTKNPYSLTYRNTDDTLIVTMNNSPSVRAYKLQ